MSGLKDHSHYPLLPLTHPQKRIWYMENIHPGTSMHNIIGSVKIKGAAEFPLLEQAIHLQITRHDGLRTRLVEQEGEVGQWFAPYSPEALPLQDFSDHPNAEIAFERWIESEARKPIPLDGERLFAFHLFRINEETHGFLLIFHHLISDGWSSVLVIDEICQTYAQLKNQKPIENQAAPSYIQFWEREQQYLQSDRCSKDKEFWLGKYATLPETLPVPGHASMAGRRNSYQLDASQSIRIKALTQEHRSSLNTFFILIYLIYLHKTTGLEDLVIGTPVLNRSGRKEKAMVGMFTSTMPLRCRMEPDKSFLSMLQELQHEVAECYFHQKYPYDRLLQDLELKRKGYDQLFQTCVNYYNTKTTTSCGDMPVEVREHDNGCQLYAMQLIIKDWGETERLTLDVDYRTANYSEAQVEQMIDHLYTLIDAVLEAPHAPIQQLPNMSALQKDKLLVAFNQTRAEFPRRLSVTQLFEQQVRQTPNKWAVRHGQQAITYRQLNERANQLARFLKCKGVNKETIVGVMTDHAIETVVGILAILKAGGAYLPIDPAYPDERTLFMLEDTSCTMVMVNQDERRQWPDSILQIDLRDAMLYAGEGGDLSVAHHPNDLAYIIYTSGSTGKPKGVMIEHHSLTHYIWWANKVYVKGEEVFALYSSLAFDLTVTSIFTPLISGGTIEVYRDDGEDYVLHRIVRERKATVVKLTPAHLSLLRESDNRHSAVKRLIVGGDDLKAGLAQEVQDSFGGTIDIFNEYGPTEATVGCMTHLFDREKDKRVSVPIGIPADNMQLYVLDAQLNPVPPNTLGELYIAGEGLARGYWNREELNAERFLLNPFEPGARMYRTGDLAKFLDNGLIEYGGRNDHQVKLHGYRIELGEIEACLLSHPSVKDAIVLDWATESGSKFLCAYVVAAMPVNLDDLKRYVQERLPFHMVPAVLIELDALPLNRNGKVDRKALPVPEARKETGHMNNEPLTEREAVFLEQVKAVLQTGNIGMQDNFYHLGGDSIKAIQLSAKLRSAGIALKVREILDQPVLAQMLASAAESGMPGISDQRKAEIGGPVGEWPIVSWFWEQAMVNPAYYNQSVLLKLHEDMAVAELEEVLQALMSRYDAFRIRMDVHDRSLHYEQKPARIKVGSCSLAHLQEEEQLTELERIGAMIKSGIASDPRALFRACKFDLGQNGYRLLLTAHHLIVDGVSWRIVLDDFYELYMARKQGKEASLPAPTHSLRAWASHLRSHQDKFKAEIGYWLSEEGTVAGVKPELHAGDDTVASSETIRFALSPEETVQFQSSAHQAYRTDSQDLLCTALALALFESFHIEQAVIELEGHGREPLDDSIDLSRTVGWFTSMYPVRLSVSDGTLAGAIKSTKEKLRGIPRKGIGYGVWRTFMNGGSVASKDKPVRLNYLGELDTSANHSLFALSDERSGAESDPANPLTALIEFNAWIVGGCLQVHATYSRNRFYASTMRAVMDNLRDKLKTILTHCCTKGDSEFTPSDFETAKLSQDELDGLLL